MTEQWRSVPDYEGLYEVSDMGRVRSLGRYVNAPRGPQRWVSPRILKPGMRGDYLTVGLWEDGHCHRVSIHRLVLLTFIGDPPNGHEACHTNGDQADNRLANLRWDTKSANAQDTLRHGTHPEARRTHCQNNHPLIGDNITFRNGTGRICKACRSEYNRRQYQKRKSA